MATASPPSPIEWTWPAKTRPPLELQLLPPPPFAASESPWGIDPSRLQQLMMGTSAASSPAAGINHTPCTDLGGLFDDRGSLQPLPSGWERCLDLQSGKVFLKQSDDAANSRAFNTVQRRCEEQGIKDEKRPGSSSTRGGEALRLMNVEQRQDWSSRWLKGDQHGSGAAAANKKSSWIASSNFRHGADSRHMPTYTALDGDQPDLDLRLTNEKLLSSTAAGAANEMGKWQQSTKLEKPAASDRFSCNMVTAVCSKCLMYVLLRRSKAVCPRCSLPIIIEGTPMSRSSSTSVSRKRPLPLPLPLLDSGS